MTGVDPTRTPVPARHGATRLGRALVIALVRAYQIVVSPLLGPACRFEPSCSQYMAQAIARHGALRGGWMGLRRLCRCHPLGEHGFDPVP